MRGEKTLFAFVVLIIFFGIALPLAKAHEGHDHGDDTGLSTKENVRIIGGNDDVEVLKNGNFKVEVKNTDYLVHGVETKADLAVKGMQDPNFGPNAPQRNIVCAKDYYQQIVYARPANQASNYDAVAEDIRAQVKKTNAVLNQNSLSSGGPTADYKVGCDQLNRIDIKEVVYTGDAQFDDVMRATKAQLGTNRQVDYSMFIDDTIAGGCGIGNFASDETNDQYNRNNEGNDYSAIWRNCWFGRAYMHENGHNQGAVQYNAPHSTGSGKHCWEDEDIMCYSPDDGDIHQWGTWYNPKCLDKQYFDCGNDDYFNSSENVRGYLKHNWNIGASYNRFITYNKREDKDNDGVLGSGDFCPNSAGSELHQGCNDSDEDGLYNNQDMCPQVAVPFDPFYGYLTKGCPDSDKDFTANFEDECPEEKGQINAKGCPDKDYDGVSDAKDQCPDDKGSRIAEGCLDADNDGVYDQKDRCQNEYGKQDNGCLLVRQKGELTETITDSTPPLGVVYRWQYNNTNASTDNFIVRSPYKTELYLIPDKKGKKGKRNKFTCRPKRCSIASGSPTGKWLVELYTVPTNWNVSNDFTLRIKESSKKKRKR